MWRHDLVVRWIIPILIVVLLDEKSRVSGHGMMWDPPARATMWRVGFKTPINYDDNALNCGGRGVSYKHYVNLKYLLHNLLLIRSNTD